MMTTDTWTSPAEVMQMLFDVRERNVEDLDLALLRPRSRQRGNKVRQLLRAKLQPVRPDEKSWATRCGLPVTARDFRLVVAEGAPDPVSLSQLVDSYDEATRPHQRLLAAVLTVKAAEDAPVHRLMTAATAFATHRLARDRQLSSVVVLHTPNDELAVAAVHAHVVVFARAHRQAGFGPVDPDLTDEAHAFWADEWRSFLSIWNAPRQA